MHIGRQELRRIFFEIFLSAHLKLLAWAFCNRIQEHSSASAAANRSGNIELRRALMKGEIFLIRTPIRLPIFSRMCEKDFALNFFYYSNIYILIISVNKKIKFYDEKNQRFLRRFITRCLFCLPFKNKSDFFFLSV